VFSGEYEHTIDEKGRLIIPADFRAELAEGAFITRGLDGCLSVYPPAVWEAKVEELSKLPDTRRNVRYLKRMLLAGLKCKLDKQGRILLPAPLREYAGIKSEVVIIGMDSRLEIWSKERWQEKVIATIESKSSEFAEQLAELGLL